KNEGSVWSPSTTLTSLPKTNAKAVLTSMDWDIITIQQASGYSGLSGTYNDDINTIINVVKTYCPNAKIYWHMTWAYQSNSGHADFAKYDKDRTKMYNGIIDAVQNKILTNDSFSGVIPVGTMIENLRGLVGDNITRDGYHLKYEEGRFAAGMCWYAYLTGKDVADIKFRPTASITPEFLESIKIAVSHAIEKPFEVTDK
ncbi:MAG: DUF4886 domain-containing protein, partial [Clostridia bacterium]|nr:DUF4886 domain-containing protein [Clostridia bacterium]